MSNRERLRQLKILRHAACVKDFDDLIAWMNSQIACFRDRVRNTESSTPVEASNRDVLLTRADDLEALIGLWPEFEKEFGRGAA